MPVLSPEDFRKFSPTQRREISREDVANLDKTPLGQRLQEEYGPKVQRLRNLEEYRDWLRSPGYVLPGLPKWMTYYDPWVQEIEDLANDVAETRPWIEAKRRSDPGQYLPSEAYLEGFWDRLTQGGAVPRAYDYWTGDTGLPSSTYLGGALGRLAEEGVGGALSRAYDYWTSPEKPALRGIRERRQGETLPLAPKRDWETISGAVEGVEGAIARAYNNLANLAGGGEPPAGPKRETISRAIEGVGGAVAPKREAISGAIESVEEAIAPKREAISGAIEGVEGAVANRAARPTAGSTRVEPEVEIAPSLPPSATPSIMERYLRGSGGGQLKERAEEMRRQQRRRTVPRHGTSAPESRKSVVRGRVSDEIQEAARPDPGLPTSVVPSIPELMLRGSTGLESQMLPEEDATIRDEPDTPPEPKPEEDDMVKGEGTTKNAFAKAYDYLKGWQ